MGLIRAEGGGRRGMGRGGAPPYRHRAVQNRHGPTRGGRMGWFRQSRGSGWSWRRTTWRSGGCGGGGGGTLPAAAALLFGLRETKRTRVVHD